MAPFYWKKVRICVIFPCEKVFQKEFFHLSIELGNQLIRCATVKTQSSQNWRGGLAWKPNIFAIFKRYWCPWSTIPLCRGVLGKLVWWITPYDHKKSWKELFKNSWLLLDLMQQIWTTNCVLVMAVLFFFLLAFEMALEHVDPKASNSFNTNTKTFLD